MKPHRVKVADVALLRQSPAMAMADFLSRGYDGAIALQRGRLACECCRSKTEPLTHTMAAEVWPEDAVRVLEEYGAILSPWVLMPICAPCAELGALALIKVCTPNGTVTAIQIGEQP